MWQAIVLSLIMADSVDAHRALWASVLFQLVADANNSADEQAYGDAQVWLRSRSRLKDDLIMRAGVEPTAFWLEAGRGFPAWRNHMSNQQKHSAARRSACG